MANAEDVVTEIMGTNEPKNHHDVVIHDGTKYRAVVRTLQSKVSETLKEVTKWLPIRTVDELFKQEKEVDTVLGHAVRAASWGYHNYKAIRRVEALLEGDRVERRAMMGSQKALDTLKDMAAGGDEHAVAVYEYATRQS